MLLLSCNQPVYAGHAQVIECYYSDHELLSELNEWARLSRFVSLTKHSSFHDFIESRKQMYSWDRGAYPMYYSTELKVLKEFPTHDVGDPNTTAILRGVYGSLYENQKPTFENLMDLKERRAIEQLAPSIRSLVANESGALTAAFFRREQFPDAALQETVNRTLSRILPYQFTSIYTDIYDAFTGTGFPKCRIYEDAKSFPHLDFEVNLSVFAKLGIESLLIDFNSWPTSKIIRFLTHGDFQEFVAAKSDFLSIVAETKVKGDLALERPKMLAAVRSAPINRIELAGFEIQKLAFELRRAAELVCSNDPIANARRIAMAKTSWGSNYLILTATDVEDEVLREALTARGFSPPTIIHGASLSSVFYFRKDVGKLHHVRTSAGSIGTSGSLLMARNAISELKPKFVISYGICFGLNEKKQSLDDIVVSDSVFEYEKQRVSAARPEDRGSIRDASAALLSRVRAQQAIWQGTPIHIGLVASGEKLVDDAIFVKQLKERMPRAIAGEMETAGISAVCTELQVPFIMVKGICDFGHNKDDKHQRTAAQAAVKLVFDALIV